MDGNLIEIILDFSFFIILFFISLKDLKEKEIPNFLMLGIIFLGTLKIIFLREDFEKKFLGLGVFPVFFLFLYGYAGDFLKKEIIGFGDIKLDFSFFIILFFISLKDLKEKEIPNFLTLGIIFLGILKIIFLREDFEKNFLGLGVFPVFFLFLYGYAGDFLKKEIIGFGDIKLVSGIGFYFGYSGIYFGYSGIYNLIIFHNIIFILGFLFLIPIFFLKKIKKEEEVPFAPCICLGAVIYKFFVERI